MKKRIISIISVITILCGTYTVALAGESNPLNATRNSLKSYGSIIYSDGADNTVEIHADDLYTLADQLDTYKSRVVNQLEEINTYFSYDSSGFSLASADELSIVHTPPDSDDTVDPLSLNFDTIIEGIAASQSIPITVKDYGYSEDTDLFKTHTGLLMTDNSNPDMEQINISAASLADLSAGTAAWVNGKLFLGTGANNNAYYTQGYADGYSKIIGSTNISYVYHKHVTGDGTESSNTIYSSSDPGGCYRNAGDNTWIVNCGKTENYIESVTIRLY